MSETLKPHPEDEDAYFMPVEDDNICLTCDGTGTHNGHLCKDCGGLGYTE